jgi:UrcA family protein
MSHHLALSALAGLGLAAAAAVFTPSAQPAVGEVVVRATPLPGVELRSKVIQIADLDLRRPEGVESLLGRIRGAAHDVCTPQPTHLANMADVEDYDRCFRGAMDGAVAEARNPMLDDLYARVR